MQRTLCIHGHFYQPPRENPWTGDVEREDSASPFHDWNERVTAECYAPNAAARLYEKISFDFGPTLLAWLERKAPEVYRSVLAADRESLRRFSGHGSAIAQAYNHMILPLANARDKRTQILWGLRDFEHRFGRSPEGMWLPETAVDVETLEILSEMGIRFTILSPRQARAVHRIHDHYWFDVSEGIIDPAMPYRVELPSGRHVTVFFYDEAVSRAVAFEGLLHDGETFVQRLMNAFSDDREWPQLVHIATDGETFGHHHKFGEMALAYALEKIEAGGLVRLTNYGEYLSRMAPTHQVEIRENTSWSCPHGVERWRSDCGCRAGGQDEWRQAWRGPLREALDWLRDTLASPFEVAASEYVKEAWEARDDSLEVVLNPSQRIKEPFFVRHAVRDLSLSEQTKVLTLMELQRFLMLMYTSCGWFFSDPSDLGTLQVLKYAARAVQMAEEIFGAPLREDFRNRLQGVKGNLPGLQDGRRLFDAFIGPYLAKGRG